MACSCSRQTGKRQTGWKRQTGQDRRNRHDMVALHSVAMPSLISCIVSLSSLCVLFYRARAGGAWRALQRILSWCICLFSELSVLIVSHHVFSASLSCLSPLSWSSLSSPCVPARCRTQRKTLTPWTAHRFAAYVRGCRYGVAARRFTRFSGRA